MVLLTMTSSMVDALERLGLADGTDESSDAPSNEPGDKPSNEPGDEPSDQLSEERPERPATLVGEPSLAQPAVGKPISHGQVVDLWTRLQSSQPSPCSLEKLLQGSCVFIPPPPPKPEPSDEYKALMARLRREEAARAYQRLINPPPPTETFGDRFPTATQAFFEVNRPTSGADLGDDDVTYRQVHRQVMLIINFLVSIVGVAATLWVAARWWSLPSRLLLALGGAIVVAIAEVGVYQGYVWRMAQAKSKQKAIGEVKEVVKTWVVGQDAAGEEEASPIVLKSRRGSPDGAARRRRTAAVEGGKADT